MDQPNAATPPVDLPPLEGARPPTLDEKALFDAYTEAVKGALEAATGAAEKVLTAVFSLGTAYVALLGLLRPDKAVGLPLVALPFVALATAGVLAMLALLSGFAPTQGGTVADFSDSLWGAIRAKRWLSGTAVVGVVVALILAGIVVIRTPFAPPIS